MACDKRVLRSCDQRGAEEQGNLAGSFGLFHAAVFLSFASVQIGASDWSPTLMRYQSPVARRNPA